MNYLSKITSFAAVLLLMFCLQPASGQSNIDTNRMQRDINIMENILEEMFKTRWQARGNNVRVRSGGFSFGRNDNIRGTYLPEYGVIFNIPGGSPAFVMETDADGKGFAYSFQYGDSNGKNIDEESITARIVGFLRDYGSSIGQLSNSDRVMVIYNSNTPDRRFGIFHPDGNDEKAEKHNIPTISVVAKKSDLQAFRSGDLSDEQFHNRLDISTTEGNKQTHKDLKVMAGIFESAFEDSDSETFRIAGSVDYLKLDNFGVLFSFKARYAQQNDWNISGLDLQLNKLREDLTALSDSIKINKIEIKQTLDSTDFDNQKKARKKTLIAYNQFVKDLKGYLVDYGRTLSSIESSQHILVSVNLPSRYNEIPERLDLQIRKSQLDAMDKGSMSRNQVMDQIQVQEY